MLRHDARLERQLVAAGIQRHDDFFQRGISRTFADAVDGALDLTRAALHRRQRIRYGQAQIVMAVDADHGAIAQQLSPSARSERVFFGNRIAYRVRKINRPRAGCNYCARHLLQVVRIGSRGVFGGKLHIISCIHAPASPLPRLHPKPAGATSSVCASDECRWWR